MPPVFSAAPVTHARGDVSGRATPGPGPFPTFDAAMAEADVLDTELAAFGNQPLAGELGAAASPLADVALIIGLCSPFPVPTAGMPTPAGVRTPAALSDFGLNRMQAPGLSFVVQARPFSRRREGSLEEIVEAPDASTPQAAVAVSDRPAAEILIPPGVSLEPSIAPSSIPLPPAVLAAVASAVYDAVVSVASRRVTGVADPVTVRGAPASLAAKANGTGDASYSHRQEALANFGVSASDPAVAKSPSSVADGTAMLPADAAVPRPNDAAVPSPAGAYPSALAGAAARTSGAVPFALLPSGAGALASSARSSDAAASLADANGVHPVPPSLEKGAPADPARTTSASPWRLVQPGNAGGASQLVPASLQASVRSVAPADVSGYPADAPGTGVIARLHSDAVGDQVPGGVGGSFSLPTASGFALQVDAGLAAAESAATPLQGTFSVSGVLSEVDSSTGALSAGPGGSLSPASQNGHSSDGSGDPSGDAPPRDATHPGDADAIPSSIQIDAVSFQVSGSVDGAPLRVSGIKASAASAKVAQAAVDMVLKSREAGGRTMVSVEPEGLGRISIMVDRGADGVAAIHISAERLTTTDLLRSERADLSEILDKSGQAGEGHTLSFSWDGPSDGRQPPRGSFASAAGLSDTPRPDAGLARLYHDDVAYVGLRAAARGGVDIVA